jgi:hypothetical protein
MRHLSKIGIVTLALTAALPALAQYQPNYQTAPQQPAAMGTQPMYGGMQPPPPQGYAPQGMPMAMPQYTPQQGQQPAMQANGLTIGQWFQQYDAIRRAAQMNPMERQQADGLMSQGLSILVPGENKLATKQLLANMVGRYQRACMQLQQLPQIPPTQQLHQSYWNYFNTAGGLFNDYLRVQDNLMVRDATTGQPVAAGLLQRKQMLEGLEGRCKQMDTATRTQFGVPPYQY